MSSLNERFTDIHARSKALYSGMVDHPENMTPQTQQGIATLAQDNKQMETSLRELGSGLEKDFQAELDVVSTWNQRQRTFGILVLLIALACGGSVAGYVINRQIAQPLKQLANRLRDIAEGEGDLTLRLDFTSKDEIGETGASFDLFMDKLQDIMRKVASNTGQLASATEEISASATLMAQRAETQQSQTTQVATSMQEMSSTVLLVSENSTKAAGASRQAAETARQGGLIVEQALNNMRTIAGSVKDTSEKMVGLGKSSDQIGHIAGVIDDIADQTNLLALNAAIEAARAGEQGRGFAVVADEVRKLAERTTIATKEIAQMISTIQNETKTAVTAMAAGTRQVEEGLQSTTQAGDALKQIIHMSEGVGEMITQIATAATEQSSATEEVNKNINDIASITREAALGSQQSAKACEDLTQLAGELQDVVSKFKLEDSESSTRRRPSSAGTRSSLKTRPELPEHGSADYLYPEDKQMAAYTTAGR